MSWFEVARRNLLAKSVEQNDFKTALKEFIYVDLIDNEDAQSSCELCHQPNIRYEYLVRNTKNNNELFVGSECIKKFVDELNELNVELYDENNNVVTQDRLETDKKNYFKRITLLLIKAYWKKNMTDFKQSVITSIMADKALTMNQLKYLKDIYNYGKKRDTRYATAMKNTIKVSMRKRNHKYQWKKLNNEDKTFIKVFLSTQQKRSLEQFDLIGY